MSILSTEQVGHSFHDRWVFNNLTFGIDRGDRIALVGINGTGKSTLLKVLSEIIKPTEGIVVKEKGLSVGYLPQDPDLSAHSTINDFIYSQDNVQQQLIREYDQLTDNENFDKNKLIELSEKLTELNAWEYEHSIKTILNRLQINNFDQKIESLSGGQKKRLSLAKLLIDEPDVYILDEPTNHLDIETIEWLEKFFSSGQKTVILVSHDRYFLDEVCSEIRELDRGQMYIYKGNYQYFLEKKFEREEQEIVVADKARNLWRKELEWMRRQPKARGTKSKARIEAFDSLTEKSKAPAKKESIQLSVKMARQGGKIIELADVSKSFSNHVVISNFSYVFKKQDRIGLAGKNGTGKSTFLNLLVGQEQPSSGVVDVGETVKIGYYKQSGLSFNEQDRVIDVVKSVADYIQMANGDTITASQLLTIFLFPPQKQHGFISNLSGGEKKRLQLMRVLMANPNFLILDEPSNDLDIDTLNVLEDFLVNYSGVLVLVSHDRYLLDKLTEQLFIFEGDGEIVIYNGNYSDYKTEKQIAVDLEKTKAKKNQTSLKEKAVVKEKKLSYKEQLEHKSLESEISELEDKHAILTEKLSGITDHVELQELVNTLEDLQNEINIKSDRWLELSEFI